ncbi:Transmembrane_domain-containing protein [Hexamita inflata]|uniref:Transmembrane domain-containing protein n=1 Tax=Hexamita inflata TaxID=28002 RepID=A0AA86NE56_9EUKA|nr:Transmembrane domain-containing protein [Hexamita inflata]
MTGNRHNTGKHNYCLYLCFMRSAIPHTKLPVIKSCSLEPFNIVNNVYQEPQPVPQRDQLNLPSIDISQIVSLTHFQENEQPLTTQVRPQYLDAFDNIKSISYDINPEETSETVLTQKEPMNTGGMMLAPATEIQGVI